jgi:hypothetical protein
VEGFQIKPIAKPAAMIAINDVISSFPVIATKILI